MPKTTSRIERGDIVELEIDSMRVPCEVVRAPMRIVIPPGTLTFWAIDHNGDVHVVSAPPDYEFAMAEPRNRLDA